MQNKQTIKYWTHAPLHVALLIGVLALSVGALNVDYVGSIEESLYAPTSLEVYDNGLAVLEPFSDEINLFTVDGIMVQKLHLMGQAQGLTHVDNNRFMFCDRKQQAIIEVDLDNNSEQVFVGQSLPLSDPIDLILQNNKTLFILDAGQAAIFEVGLNRDLVRTISLVDTDGQKLKYASSFCYDADMNRFYVLDQLSSRICVIGEDGIPITSFGSFGDGAEQISRGGELALSADGRIFVTDRFQGRILVYSSDGECVGIIGDPSQEEPGMAVPTGIDVDDDGVLYVASTMTPSIQIYHVALSPDISKLAAAQPQFPLDGAELSSDKVTIIAFADILINGREVTGFDFQLFDTNDSVQPMHDSLGVEGTLHEVGSSESQRLIANWTIDAELSTDQDYAWRTRTQGRDTVGEWSSKQTFRLSSLPGEFHLDQNYPNPFNPYTKIGFSLPHQGDVTLEVFSLLGQRVVTLLDGPMPSGYHVVNWNGIDDNGSPVATGVYFYRLSSEEFVQTKKMVLLK